MHNVTSTVLVEGPSPVEHGDLHTSPSCLCGCDGDGSALILRFPWHKADGQEACALGGVGSLQSAVDAQQQDSLIGQRNQLQLCGNSAGSSNHAAGRLSGPAKDSCMLGSTHAATQLTCTLQRTIVPSVSCVPGMVAV